MRRKHAGLGEITSAIIIVAVFATATILLVTTYQDRAATESGAIRQMLDLQRLKAEELVSTSVVQCKSGAMSFLMHNYGLSVLNATEMEFWKVDISGAPTVVPNVAVNHLNGSVAGVIPEGFTVFVDIPFFNCAEGLVIITNAQNYLVIDPT